MQQRLWELVNATQNWWSEYDRDRKWLMPSVRSGCHSHTFYAHPSTYMQEYQCIYCYITTRVSTTKNLTVIVWYVKLLFCMWFLFFKLQLNAVWKVYLIKLTERARERETERDRDRHTDRHTDLSLIHIWRCRREWSCRSRWSPYH